MKTKTQGLMALEVSKKEESIAKAQGACWNQSLNRWCLSCEQPMSDIMKWLPETLPIEKVAIIIEAPFYLIQSTRYCFSCLQETPVYCLVAEKVKDCFLGVETLPEEKQEIMNARQPIEGFFRLTNSQYLPGKILQEIHKQTRTIYLDSLGLSNDWYYANHCDCGFMFSDKELFHPGEIFMSDRELDSNEIKVIELPLCEAFHLEASHIVTSPDYLRELIVQKAKEDALIAK